MRLQNKRLVFLLILLLAIQAGLIFILFNQSKSIKNISLTEPHQTDKANQKLTKNTRLLFLGDIMLDRQVKEKISKQPSGVNWLVEKLAGQNDDFFKGLDLVSANLEGALTNQGEHYAPKLIYDFAFSPDDIAQLVRYNFNFFNLANNHLADQGERGVKETESNLTNLKVNFSGCTDGLVDNCSSKIINLSGIKLGLVGLSMVYHDFDLVKAVKIIKELVGKCDMIIVNIHWGQEYQHQYNKKQQQVAHQLIDAGVDLIIGHHPHVVQGIEIYNKKLTFYSLGNFIFDQYFSSATQQGLAVGINLIGDGKSFYLFPLKSVASQVELMSGKEKEEFLENLVKWSKLDNGFIKQVEDGRLIL